MKSLILALCLMSSAALAETVTQGGFGSDGVTGESIPTVSSTRQAAEVYAALSVKADAKGYKEVVVADGSAISCQKPKNGMSGTLYAGCEILLRENTKAEVTYTNEKDLKGDVTFTGKIASELMKALDVDVTVRVGGSSKTAGNIVCTMTVRPGRPVKCTIKNAVLSQWEVDPAAVADFN